MYPVRIGGPWAGPPEACGGPEAVLEQRDAASWRVRELLREVVNGVYRFCFGFWHTPSRGGRLDSTESRPFESYSKLSE
jgi:hypothetical protein